jgi:sec-independent protein translocase protein TatB
MFDIGFSEIVLIGIVALVIFGPEELPRVARTAGHLLGRLRRYVADVKSDISREMEASEMKSLVADVHESARAFQSSVHEQATSFKAEFDALASVPEDVRAALQESPLHVDAPDGMPASVGSGGAASNVLPGVAILAEQALASEPPRTSESMLSDASSAVAHDEQVTSSMAEEDGEQLDLFGEPIPTPTVKKD